MSLGVMASVFICLDVLIAVMCCVGNVSVMWTVWKSGALNQTTFCLIVSLAFADFLVGSVVVPLTVLQKSRIETSLGSCLFMSCVVIVPLQASVFHLLAIAVDRYLRVSIPFRYKSTVSKRGSWILAGVCWMLACLMGFLSMFGWYSHDTMKHLNSTTLNCSFTDVIPTSYLVKFTFFSCLIPLLTIMITLYCLIFIKISRSRGKAGISESDVYNRKEHRLAGSLLLVLALFIMCGFPLHIMLTIRFYSQSIRVSSTVMYCGVILSHVNSMLNPVIYAFRVPKIRAEFTKILRELIGSQQQEDKNSRTPEIHVCNTNTVKRKTFGSFIEMQKGNI